MFYAFDSQKECLKFYPDTQDKTAFLGFRRITAERERELNAPFMKNGKLVVRSLKDLKLSEDTETLVSSEDVQLAWSLVTWQGYVEPDGVTEIPYDFQYDFDREPPEEQVRKILGVSRLEASLKTRVLLRVKEGIFRLGDDLKNYMGGWLAEPSLGPGSNGTANGAGSPSPVPTAAPPAPATTNRRRAK